MRLIFVIIATLTLPLVADASVLDVFKDEDGHTKWQYVANFSGSVLILLLSFTLAGLTISQFQLRSRNEELREVKGNLEKTVAKRTEKLNQSNELLQQTNAALQGEVAKHQETSNQLFNSQNYLNSILSSMPSMLVGLNANLEITHWNKTAEIISGISSAKALGENLWQAYPAITISPEAVESVINSGNAKVIKHNQTGQYYFDITIYPLSGDQKGIVILIENVTQRSLAENQLIQRDKLASVGELASTMAHDINIPLRMILSDVEIIKKELQSEKETPAKILQQLEHAINSGKQASIIIDNLLDFSASQGSEKHEEDITNIIDHSVELAQSTLAERNGLHFKDVLINRNYESNLPPLPCYSGELQQVFLSIFRHACFAMNNKGGEYQPEINLDVINAYDAIWVKVQHNGSGLTIEEQQSLFEPISHNLAPEDMESVISENRLSFPHFIVTEHHHGQMAVTSDPEIGTTFHIEFRLN